MKLKLKVRRFDTTEKSQTESPRVLGALTEKHLPVESFNMAAKSFSIHKFKTVG
jgi:hypothetical protein